MRNQHPLHAFANYPSLQIHFDDKYKTYTSHTQVHVTSSSSRYHVVGPLVPASHFRSFFKGLPRFHVTLCHIPHYYRNSCCSIFVSNIKITTRYIIMATFISNLFLGSSERLSYNIPTAMQSSHHMTHQLFPSHQHSNLFTIWLVRGSTAVCDCYYVQLQQVVSDAYHGLELLQVCTLHTCHG